MKFSNWLSQRAVQKKDAIALIFKSSPSQKVERWTYAELEVEVNHWVERLQALGIKSGDRVGLLLPNHPRYIFIIHALTKCDAIAVFLNTRLTSKELDWQIEDSQVKHLLHEKIVFPHLAEKQSSHATLYNQVPVIDSEHIQGIFYTSGTTGKPKSVPLTYGNHYHSAIASAERLEMQPDDNWLLCMPMFHVGGLAIAWRSVISGFCLTLLPKFDEQNVLEAIASERVTLISLVPTMLERLLQDDQWQNLQKLRGILLGGAPASLDLIERCLSLNLPIMPTYGMTETASQITTLLPHEVSLKRGSSGSALSGMHLRVMDLENVERELAIGEIGQIMVRGANVMRGYLNQSQNNYIQDNWLPTGDLGYLDGDRYLYLVSRRSDLIISGGENIYPSEIEAILSTHPAIAEVCVVGMSDRDWGQIVAAVVVLKAPFAEANLTVTDIRDFCEQQSLARYKLPKTIFIWKSLPKSASDKILRQEISDHINK
ncbi:o-succinylbenzoate--CoA ligase [Pseudanabaena biceps]|nr:o-succinylbenzoate--CoA ligase [Pseudanabaena biceps]